MKYELYSEVPDSEKEPIKGSDIKWIAKRDHNEVIVIKNDKFDHKVYHPETELEDNKIYYVYNDAYVAGSGIAYGKMLIFTDMDLDDRFSRINKMMAELDKIHHDAVEKQKDIADELLKYANEYFIGRTFSDKKCQIY